jgi:putative endopeptidase
MFILRLIRSRMFTAITAYFLLLTPIAMVAQNLGANSSADSIGASEQAKADPKLEHFDPNLVDKNLNPCDDFYKYACNKWTSANPIPPDQVAWSTRTVCSFGMKLRCGKRWKRAAETTPIAAPYNRKSATTGRLVWTKAAGLKTLQPELSRISDIKSKKEITLEIAHLHHLFPGAWDQEDNQTNSPFFGFTGMPDYDDASKAVAQIDQGGLSLPGRNYYLKTDEKSVETLKKFRAHVRKMFVLAGESEAQAGSDADAVLALETALAKAQRDNVTRRDPKNMNNRMTLAQVRELTRSIDWDVYLKEVKAPASDHYIVTTPGFFRAEEKLLEERPLDEWKAYMRWQLIYRAAPFLNQAMVDENFDFFYHTLAGQQQNQPRWRRCIRNADRDLGEALGQAYVDRAFPPESRARVLGMVHAIEISLHDDIETVRWMSPATKE